ncbi:hypothetical protein KCU95_g10868, partial [Aureobasidium melanogenum]
MFTRTVLSTVIRDSDRVSNINTHQHTSTPAYALDHLSFHTKYHTRKLHRESAYSPFNHTRHRETTQERRRQWHLVMSDHNTYLACKRETRYILWWLCHTSNAILQSIPKKNQNNDFENRVNTTGQVTTRELILMAKRVASRLSQQQTPSTIFRLFRSVISARSSAHVVFVEMASNHKDEEMDKSNETHKYFIDRLVEAFEILGGSQWATNQDIESDKAQTREEIEEVIFSNAFSALDIHQCADMSDDEAGSETLPATKHSDKPGRTKCNQKSKQKKNKRTRVANDSVILDVPLESYCLVDGPEGIHADYRMALVSVFVEWWKLRNHVQTMWFSVAYDDVNHAVAGAVSEMAITMIKKTALAVFVEFPAGFDTYQAMTRDFSRDELQDIFSSHPEFKEAFSFHTYQDLLEFLGDFQKNRTGKPTKRMQSRLSLWDPNFDLQQATLAEKVEWRRSYTINWLYDLVNVFSPRKLYGMESFAELITTLAVQKPGTKVQSQILPHHVFQLQCIVDSFTASRGWGPGIQRCYGHFTKESQGKVSPTDCLKLFLGTHDCGFLSGAEALSNRLKEYQRTSRDQLASYRIGWMLLDRFRNGLWEYSPFLCGVGLVEALEISYRLSMLCWDTILEVIIMLRFQESLVQKGYMKQSDELLSFLTTYCAPHGPHFSELSGREKTESDARRLERAKRYKHHDIEQVIGAHRDVRDALSLDGNAIFRRKSQLLVYHESGWDPARLIENRLELDCSLLVSYATVWERDKLGNSSERDIFLRLYRENATRFNGAFANESASNTPNANQIAASTQRLGHSEYGPTGLGQLLLAELDLINDICYQAPLSAIDYTWLTMKFMKIFDAVEERLIELRNPLYLQCILFDKNARMAQLQILVRREMPGHKECLEVLAKEMKKQSMTVEQFMYWGRHDSKILDVLGSERVWCHESEVKRYEEQMNRGRKEGSGQTGTSRLAFALGSDSPISMARDLNGSLRVSYFNYKKDTRYILWWLAHASNSIVAATPDDQKAATDVINTTGHMTCAEIKIMSRRVGTAFLKRGEQVPSTILYLFDSVIKARQEMSGEYKAMFTGIQAEEFQRSNDAHQAFIDTLAFAFKALGGDQWLLTGADKQHETLGSEKEIEDIVFANAFSALSVHQTNDHFETSTNSCTVEAPLEEYCVEDGPDETFDHALVIGMAFAEGLSLRRSLQACWQMVVYDHLNIAVAGVETNMAVALVKTTAAAVFLEADSKVESSDSYINLLDEFSSAALMAAGETEIAQIRKVLGIYVYNSLVDFVIDYRKNRTGRPTKRLQIDLDRWDPACNLEYLSADERLEWRRLYTINWLYELVNVFSHIVRQEKRLETASSENFIWSLDGPYRRDARLFGIEDFASSVTTWAMQKPGTPFEDKILLHHVFQLHCIVDSFTVAQGWSPDLSGDAEFEPRPEDFYPIEAIDRFLDSHTDGSSVGFMRGVSAFLETIKRTPSMSRFAHSDNILEELPYLQKLFKNWLGVSSHAFTAVNSPPSRFEQSERIGENSLNGLWSFSPFLCGVGLAEALDISSRISLIIWNELTEPCQLMQLHKTLVYKRYLQKDLDRFKDLNDMFYGKAFHKDANPTQHFKKNRYFPGPAGPQARTLSRSATKLEDWLSLEENLFLRSKPDLLLYREFDWKFWCIPEDKMIPTSLLGSLCVVQTKRTTDPVTGKIRFEDTDLIKNAREQNRADYRDDTRILRRAEFTKREMIAGMRGLEEPLASLANLDIAASAQDFEHTIDDNPPLSTFVVWQLLKAEIWEDVCSNQPLCGFNYLWLMAIILKTWTKIDDHLQKTQTPLFDATNQTPYNRMQYRRSQLIDQIRHGSSGNHRRCAEDIAKMLQQIHVFKTNCLYWDGFYCSLCGEKNCVFANCKARVDRSQSDEQG